jgi:hypothetical protein
MTEAVDWQKILDAQFLDERAFAGKMSDAAKFVWAGTLALFYGAMFADKGPLAEFFRARGFLLLLAAEFGAAAFIFDLVKNWAGRILASDAQKWLVANWSGMQDAQFPSRYNRHIKTATCCGLRLRRLNRWMFRLSILASLAAAAIVSGAIATVYFAPPTVAATSSAPAK